MIIIWYYYFQFIFSLIDHRVALWQQCSTKGVELLSLEIVVSFTRTTISDYILNVQMLVLLDTFCVEAVLGFKILNAITKYIFVISQVRAGVLFQW